jgi:hypothetical protein
MSPGKPDETDADSKHPRSQGLRAAGTHDDAEPDQFSKDVPRLLLWCNYDPFNAASVCDHINALAKFSRFDVTVLSRIGSIPDDINLELFDAVIIHYSLTLALDSYISVKTRYRLSAYDGLKALFIQDEYRFVEKTRESIRQLGITLVFTCVPSAEIPGIYPPEKLSNVSFVNVLTAYVPAWLTVYPAVPLSERKIDVGYRGRDYSAWHGRAGREKVDIGKRFLKDGRRAGLRCNIRWRERDRLYGAQWRTFLQNCRATLAVESGASVIDFEGRIGPRVETFEKLLGKAGKYDLVRERFFVGQEDRFDLSQISARVFEAIAIRTLLIMYEGGYSGVLTPWVHYLPLKKDHSNMAEIVGVLRDDIRVGEIIANAFADIAMNDRWSYVTFVASFDGYVEKMIHFDASRRSRQKAIDKIRKEHPWRLIDNPHDLHISRAGGKLEELRRFIRRVRNYIVGRTG